MSDTASTYDRLREKIQGCIQTGKVTLASGKVTDFYFDGRLVALDPEGSALLGELFLDEIRSRGDIQAVGGPTSGADPIVSATGVLAHQKGVPLQLFYVRKEPKAHGMQKRVEGPPLPAGSRVFLLDDVLTTGGSLIQAVKAVREEAGVEVVGAMVIVDREEGGEENLRSEGLELVSLFKKSDFSILTN